eukprot:1157560-Pelagomonas_calceolata.AAC.9
MEVLLEVCTALPKKLAGQHEGPSNNQDENGNANDEGRFQTRCQALQYKSNILHTQCECSSNDSLKRDAEMLTILATLH